MIDQSVSLTTLGAWGCWLTGLVLAVVNMMIPLDLLGLCAAAFAGAICLTLRMEMRRAAKSTAQVFQLGKEAERRHPSGPRGL